MNNLNIIECGVCGYLKHGECQWCTNITWKVLAVTDCKLCGVKFKHSRNGYTCNECLDKFPY